MKKKLLFLAVALLFFACSDDTNGEVLTGPHPRLLFSSLIITQTTEGTDAVIKKTFEYENNVLTKHTADQSNTANNRVITFNVTANTGWYQYRCLLNEKYYCHSIYYVNNLSLATTADFIYTDGDQRRYEMNYKTINGKQYIASITEYIIDAQTMIANVYYVLTLDYSLFDSGKIGLVQTLLGNERVQATFSITHDNEAGIPDVHLYDADLHPLDKHFEAIYGGLLGTFDYRITEVHKETRTVVVLTKETITASVEFNANAYPKKITSVSDRTKAVKYYEFEYNDRK